MTFSIIECENLTKIFDKSAALDNITIALPKGKIVGLVGPDGAGKTTLIRLMAGLLYPTHGKMIITGKETTKFQTEIHEIIGYMPQKFGLYEDLTVHQNMNLYANLKGVVGEEKKKTFEILYRFTTLEPFKNRLAGALSGGMKQKLGLACALMRKPEVLLLDEPSVGVDPISRRELWAMVQQMIDEGVSVVWSTAYLDEAERCDLVLLLNEGKLLYSGPPSDLTNRVRSRIYKMTNVFQKKRELLTKMIAHKDVCDAIVQGKDIRVLFKENISKDFDIKSLGAGEGSELVPTEPRFEDAFIDILGGIEGYSKLAEQTKPFPVSKKTIIQTIHLTKKFGNFVAAGDLSFEIPQGEIFGLLGPNGAGKTTTFRMMCGLLTPTSGQAFVNGLNLQIAPGEARSHIGYMAQKFSLYGTLSVYQNLRFFSGVYNLRGETRRKTIQNMIEIFALEPYVNESSDTLPLGFKQRLALACALMHNPEVLFLDEPTSGVDPITRREFWSHINGLVEKGITVIITTHFLDEAEYCDRIALIYQSKLIEIETPDALKDAVKSPELPTPTLEDAFIELIKRSHLK